MCNTLDTGPGPEGELNNAVAVTVTVTWEGRVIEKEEA